VPRLAIADEQRVCVFDLSARTSFLLVSLNTGRRGSIPGTAEDAASHSGPGPSRVCSTSSRSWNWEVEVEGPPRWRRRAGEGRARGHGIGRWGPARKQSRKALPGPVEQTGQKRGVDRAPLPCHLQTMRALPFSAVPSHEADEGETARRGRLVHSVGALTAERPVLTTSSVVGKTNK
jgi:hypothetical protein